MSTRPPISSLLQLYGDLLELAAATSTAGQTQTERIQEQRVERRRDLTFVRLAGKYYLVIACDSDGGIGPKPHDTVAVAPYLLGRLAARVPLMEIVASGARPLVLVDTLSVEMEPTGRGIIEGVGFEASLAGVVGDGAVTGSTEDNVPTVATGIGVTVIGIAEGRQIRIGTSVSGDAVACVGVPKSAPADEVSPDDPEAADVPLVMALRSLPFVHDVLPVGSRGIEYESRQMGASAGLDFDLSAHDGLDVRKSAGPSTCVLVSVPEAWLEALRRAVTKPVSPVGRLWRR